MFQQIRGLAVILFVFFFDWPEKHKLSRGRWNLASCQVSLDSVQRFQRRRQKCLNKSEVWRSSWVFFVGPKNTNLVEDIEIMLPVKFHWILLSEFKGEVLNVSSNKMARAAIFFSINPKNTNFVQDVEILLPVKSRCIPFSGFREVENLSANQRLRQPSWFSDWAGKHKLDRGRWDPASCRVSLHPVKRYQRRSREVSANQRSGRQSCFSDRSEKHKLGRGRWNLASCHVFFIPFSCFRGEVKNVWANQRLGRSSCFSDMGEKTQTW